MIAGSRLERQMAGDNPGQAVNKLPRSIVNGWGGLWATDVPLDSLTMANFFYALTSPSRQLFDTGSNH
jgi:hypothetical protein